MRPAIFTDLLLSSFISIIDEGIVDSLASVPVSLGKWVVTDGKFPTVSRDSPFFLFFLPTVGWLFPSLNELLCWISRGSPMLKSTYPVTMSA